MNKKGQIVSEQLIELEKRYTTVKIERFVVMPNHLHAIIILNNQQEQNPCPKIMDVVCSFKSITTKLCNKTDSVIGRKIWQSSFYDHIIRNNNEYLKICEYIDNNPLKWELDKYHIEM